MRACLAVIVAVSAPIAAPAAADDAGRMQAFTRSDFYLDLAERAIAALPPEVFRKCPGLVSNGSKVTILKPVAFGAGGRPNAGSWLQSYPVSGCGNDTTLNFWFSATADENIHTLIGVPGSTHADPLLQRDARKYVDVGAAVVARGCKAFVVTNSRFEGFGLANPPTPDPGPGDRYRPWWETWTLVGCNRTIDVPIDFQPDAKGTLIIQPGGAALRPR